MNPDQKQPEPGRAAAEAHGCAEEEWLAQEAEAYLLEEEGRGA